MNPTQLSSGDLIADRRAEYAHMLAESGENAGAADLMLQALELVPDWAAGWFRLAEYQEKAGDGDAAASALRKVLALNPDDIFGAGLKLALFGETQTPKQPPSQYVERLFDDYAARFDTALVEKLEYTVPEKLAALVEDHLADARIAHAVDLGCGTGLFGVKIRARTDWLEGFDLSANMLAKAADKQTYDHLGQADLSLSADASGLFSETLPLHRADLVSAADVLMYLGDLSGVFTLASALLSEKGFFAFSVEDAGDTGTFVLQTSLRYAHGLSYILDLLIAKGFAHLETRRTIIRKDGGKPVAGMLFIARKAD